MLTDFSHVLSPIRLGDTWFRNRIFAAPASLPDYSNVVGMTDRQKAFYALRARGGAASVATGDGIVHFETGFLHPYKLRLDAPEIYPALGDMARSVRQFGAVPTIELSHGGKFANVANFIGNMQTGRTAYGPVHETAPGGEEILEMPAQLIEKVAESYGAAARRAKAAGFGMILIHAGHGWLLQQFLSPRTNRRTDEFGGSFENRCRFLLLVLDEVRRAVGPGFPIELRMSGAEFTDGGYDLDYGIRIAQAVEQKVDLLHVSAGVHDDPRTFLVTHPPMFREHGCNVYLAAAIKKAVKVPVATIGGLTDPEMLEEVVAGGRADVVELSRQLMADPYLPRKMAEGRTDDITHCIRCFHCMDQLRRNSSMRCALNPQIGREDVGEAPAAPRRKTVLIAGGGPAGMEAALAAHSRGHRVTLFESGDALGGQTLCERYVSFKYDMYRFGQTLARRVREAGIDVRLGTSLTPALARSLAPDVIVAALGAQPARPPIPGADGPNTRTCTDLQNADPGIGARVVIIGGGLVGVESAVHFAQEGKTVTLLEMADDLARDAAWPHRLALLGRLETLGVTVRTGCAAQEITAEGVLAGGERFPADTVFLAAGLRPRADEAEALRSCAPEFYRIGDCLKPDVLFGATSGGFFAGREI